MQGPDPAAPLAPLAPTGPTGLTGPTAPPALTQAQVLEHARQLAQTVQDMPWAAHGLAIGALIAGIILWAIGERVVKPMFAVIGALVGASIGLVALPALGLETVLSIPSPLVGMAAGGVLGLGLGIALFRSAVAFSSAAAMGLAGAMIAVAYLHLSGQTLPTPVLPEPPRITLPSATGATGSPQGTTPILPGTAGAPAPRSSAGGSTTTEQATADQAKRVEDFLVALRDEGKRVVGELTPSQQWAIGGAGLVGAVGGFLFGMFMPRKSAALVTAMVGAAVWLPAATWLAHAANVPGQDLLHWSATTWTIVWAAVAAVGCLIQWSATRRRKARAAAEE